MSYLSVYIPLSRPIYRGAFDQRRQMLGRGAVADRGVGDATQTPGQRSKPHRPELPSAVSPVPLEAAVFKPEANLPLGTIAVD